MVFGQAPCSAGRMKRRNVSYLGLLPTPEGGVSDIPELYVARYGEPKPGEKVFIVTRQQKNGWEGEDKVTSEIVPKKPAGEQRAEALNEMEGKAVDTVQGLGVRLQATAEAALTLQPHMHTGCTPGAQRDAEPAVPCSRERGIGMTKEGMMKDKTGGVSTAALAGDCDQDGKSQMPNGEALQKDEDETGGAGGEAVKSGFSGSGGGDGAEVGGTE